MTGTIFIAIIVILMIMYCVAIAKNENTYKNIGIILDAIHHYNESAINNGEEPDFTLYSKMKSYDEVFRNFFDWSYKHILPSAEMELVRPYIKTE